VAVPFVACCANDCSWVTRAANASGLKDLMKLAIWSNNWMASLPKPKLVSASFKACKGSWLVGVAATGTVVAPAGDPLVSVGAVDGAVGARVAGTLGSVAGLAVAVALGVTTALGVADALAGIGAALALVLDAAGWLA
jgi:hypothetical protein